MRSGIRALRPFVCVLGACLCGAGGPALEAGDDVSGIARRKREFCAILADEWLRAGAPVSRTHEEWKHDEVEPNWAGALAALRLKRSEDEVRKANAFFAAMPLDEKVDPDMRVCEALHAYYLFRDDPALGSPARQRLLAIIRFRPAPRRLNPSIWKFGATENHAFMGHVWCLLAAQIDRDRDTVEAVGRHIDAFIAEHTRKGWLEYNSPCYVEKEAGCLILAAEWAEDPLLRRKARLGLDVLFAEHAALGLEGMLGGPACRVYQPDRDGILEDELNHNSRCDARCSGSYPLMWLLFGEGAPHPYGVLGAPLLATSTYEPPRAVVHLATAGAERGRYEFKARRPGRGHQSFRRAPDLEQPPPEAFDARVYAWVTPSFVLGSFQEVEGKYGAARSLPLTVVLRAAGSTRRAFYADLVPAGRDRQDGAAVDCVQHKNVVLARSTGGECYIAAREFEEVLEHSGWVFLRGGGVFAGFRAIGSGWGWARLAGPALSGDFIRFEQTDAAFVLEVVEAREYDGDFGHFRADALDNRIGIDGDEVSYESCSRGREGPSAEAFTVTLRPGDLPLLDGVPLDIGSYDTFDSPYLFSAWDSGVVIVRSGPERLTINVTRPRLPVRIEETIEPLRLPFDERFDARDPRWVPFLNYWRLNAEQWAWNPDGGAAGGCLRHDAAAGVKEPERGAHDAAIILRGGEGWTDYAFEASAFAAGGRFGLWARADLQDEGAGNGRWVQGYVFLLDPAHRVCRLWRARKDGHIAATAGGDATPERNDFANPVVVAEAPLPAAATYGRWTRLRLDVRAASIRCSINGEQIIEARDDLFESGSVGFFAYRGRDVRFDDVRVTPAP